MKPSRLLTLAACVIAGLAIFAGCRERPIEQRRPAPSAGISYDLALVLARSAAADIGGTVVQFTATGSMLPTLDSRAVGVAEELGAAVRVSIGDIVVFDRAGTWVTHRVVDVAADGSAFISGDNVRSDGWVPRSQIRYRLVALFYSLRR